MLPQDLFVYEILSRVLGWEEFVTTVKALGCYYLDQKKNIISPIQKLYHVNFLYLVTVSRKEIECRTFDNDQVIYSISHPPPNLNHSGKFSKDHTMFAYKSKDGVVAILKNQENYYAEHSYVNNFEVSPDGQYVGLYDFPDQHIRIHKIDSLSKLAGIIRLDIKPTLFCFSHISQYIATWDTKYGVRVWNIDLECTFITIKCKNPINELIFSPNDRFLVFQNRNAIDIWDIRENRLFYKITQNPYYPNPIFFRACCISPNSKYLAYSNSEYVVEVWDFETKTVIRRLIHTKLIGHLSFSPDGCHIVTSDHDEIIIWDLSSGEPKHTSRTENVERISFIEGDLLESQSKTFELIQLVWAQREDSIRPSTTHVPFFQTRGNPFDDYLAFTHFAE